MSKPRPVPPLSDRERILTRLVTALASSQLLRRPAAPYYGEGSYDSGTLGTLVHFAYWRAPKPGDLVLAKTGGVSRWSVGYYVESLPSSLGGALIREIGTGRTCRYENEEFVPVVGLSQTDLLEGDQYQFYLKVLRVWRRDDRGYMQPFGGIAFGGDGMVTLTVRARYGGVLYGKRGAKPYSITMPWTRHTTQKAIVAALVAGGWGTRQFEPLEEMPATEAAPVAGSPVPAPPSA